MAIMLGRCELTHAATPSSPSPGSAFQPIRPSDIINGFWICPCSNFIPLGSLGLTTTEDFVAFSDNLQPKGLVLTSHLSPVTIMRKGVP